MTSVPVTLAVHVCPKQGRMRHGHSLLGTQGNSFRRAQAWDPGEQPTLGLLVALGTRRVGSPN